MPLNEALKHKSSVGHICKNYYTEVANFSLRSCLPDASCFQGSLLIEVRIAPVQRYWLFLQPWAKLSSFVIVINVDKAANNEVSVVVAQL